MSNEIQRVIEQRPHLKEPLELYAKCLRFQQEAAKLLPKERSAMSPDESNTYPADCAAAVFRLFIEIFELPAEKLAPLGRALEEGQVDFMRLPLDEIPDLPALTCTENELASILFLLARPYFLELRQAFSLDGSQWENGRCPLCSGQATLSSVVEGPKRRLHCSYCGTSGSYRFIGCPNCGNTEASKLGTIMSEDEPGFRLSTCDECRTYVKVVESSIHKDVELDLADLISLPLDIVAQGKGFARLAPNPISLKKME